MTSSEKASDSLTRPKYRADIDGLRAVAVLAVVGFHAFPAWLKGGFVGVDLFFVISGFLISTIIFENLNSKTFSFLEFYIRRVRRIFPALLIVLSASLAFGTVTLLADEYQQLARHISAGAGFVSNYVLWGESGYFDNTADTKILIHLWSLGIEEQFYIVWPLLLWAAWTRRMNLLLVTGAVAAVSFAWNLWEVRSDPIATFYSPQTRFWELQIGSMLAYLSLFRQATLTKPSFFGNPDFRAILGAGLIAIGFALITKDRAFPGWWALLPAVGAAMVISAGARTWLSRVVLSNRVLVWFGLISFPLYLWHWPLLAFARILLEEVPSRELRVALVAIAVLLAWITYRFVENPIRWGGNSLRKASLVVLGLGLTGTVAYVTATKVHFEAFGLRNEEKMAFSKYFENIKPEWNYFERTRMLEKMRDDCSFYDLGKMRIGKSTQVPRAEIGTTCFQRKRSALYSVLIWGDSHAQHLYSGLRANLPDVWDVLIVASNGCKPGIADIANSPTDFCKKSNWFALKTVEETKPDAVIVAQQNYGTEFEELEQIGRALTTRGANKVIFVGPTPRWKADLPKLMLRELWESNPERTLIGLDDSARVANARLRDRFSRQGAFIFVDVMREFCNESGCLTRIGADRREGITSWDYGHLSPIASDYFAKHRLARTVLEWTKDADAK
jgi:peptidoglycan/LPS O-acetylase OafA/YrhL